MEGSVGGEVKEAGAVEMTVGDRSDCRRSEVWIFLLSYLSPFGLPEKPPAEMTSLSRAVLAQQQNLCHNYCCRVSTYNLLESGEQSGGSQMHFGVVRLDILGVLRFQNLHLSPLFCCKTVGNIGLISKKVIFLWQTLRKRIRSIFRKEQKMAQKTLLGDSLFWPIWLGLSLAASCSAVTHG